MIGAFGNHRKSNVQELGRNIYLQLMCDFVPERKHFYAKMSLSAEIGAACSPDDDLSHLVV